VVPPSLEGAFSADRMDPWSKQDPCSRLALVGQHGAAGLRCDLQSAPLGATSVVLQRATPPLDLKQEPLRLPWDLRLTPEQFEQVCQDNPEAVLELHADGHLIPMTPTGGETSSRNQRLGQRLLLWADRAGAAGWRVFDSSGCSACPMAPCSAPMPPWCSSLGRTRPRVCCTMWLGLWGRVVLPP
jgi:hypothetical protein